MIIFWWILQNEWVICRVFQKSAAGKKLPFLGLTRSDSFGNEFNPSSNLPPLMDSSPYNTNYGGASSHVPCFSNTMETNPQTSHYQNTNQPSYDGLINNPYNSIPLNSSENPYFPRFGGMNPFLPSQTGSYSGNYMLSDQHILKAILENHGTEMKQSMKTEAVNYSASQDTGLSSDMNAEISSVVSNYDMGRRPFDDPDEPSTSGGPIDLDTLWNY